jgi:hypothetical protein
MAGELQSQLNERVHKLDYGQRPHFIHGIYKQLVESNKGRQTNGEYRRDLEEHTTLNEELHFISAVATHLIDNGLMSHAKRLLNQYLLERSLESLNHVCDELDRYKLITGDSMNVGSVFSDVLRIDIMPSGIGLRFGTLQSQYWCMIDNVRFPSEVDEFRVSPTFKNKSLVKLELNNSPFLQKVHLIDALSVASAVMHRDEKKLEDAVRACNINSQ